MRMNKLTILMAALAAGASFVFAFGVQAQEDAAPVASLEEMGVKWGESFVVMDRQDWEEFWQSATFEQVYVAISQGADVNSSDENGNTPLHWAARWNTSPATVRLLLDSGAKVDSADGEGLTPLHVAAAWSKTPEVMELMLAEVEDVNVRGKYGETPLHAAALYGEMPQTVILLLEHGADIFAKDKVGRTPLDLAGENKHTKAMETILRRHSNEFASNDG